MSDPGDLIGLPNKDEATGKTEFMPPYWFPMDDQPVVLFLDEMNRARPEILQSVMDLSLNRKLAGRSLPAGSRVIAAVNDGEEYQLTDLDPALVSRFNVYFFSPTVGEWLFWAKQHDVDPRVIHFIEEHPDELEKNVDINKGTFDKTPDRRAWVRVSGLLQSSGNITDMNGSRCFIGFNVSLPSSLAVVSPNVKATTPCANSCSIIEKTITQSTITTPNISMPPPSVLYIIYG